MKKLICLIVLIVLALPACEKSCDSSHGTLFLKNNTGNALYVQIGKMVEESWGDHFLIEQEHGMYGLYGFFDLLPGEFFVHCCWGSTSGDAYMMITACKETMISVPEDCVNVH